MARFNVEVPHGLGAARGKAALEGLIGQMMSRFGQSVGPVEQSWQGNQLSFRLEVKGFQVSGQAAVGESRVAVTGDCPWLARGALESGLREELGRALKG